MVRQLIFIVESKYDWMYINSTVRALFDVHNVRLDHVEMKGKNKYREKAVLTKIKHLKEGILGESIVIYCYDTDNIESDPQHIKYDKEITEYCLSNNYELIWFCRNIEDVFIGRIVNQEDKEKEARKFLKSKSINQVKLNSNAKNKQNSNFLVILQKKLKRKDM